MLKNIKAIMNNIKAFSKRWVAILLFVLSANVTFAQCPAYTAANSLNGAASDCILKVQMTGGSASLSQSSASPGGPSTGNAMGATTTLYQGSVYSLCVTVGAGIGNHGLGVWFDWNGDGDFVDAGEFFAFPGNGSIAEGSQTFTNINVPAGATIGSIGMRIRYIYAVTETQSNWNTGGAWGETENYCISIAAPCNNCSNGIRDCDETGIDCGGPNCAPCPGTCFDGIQNQTETGIDCGGPCALSCTPQANISSTLNCSGAAQANIYPVSCDQIGTSAYGLSGPSATFNSGSATNPSPTPTCSYSSTDDCWIHVNLESGVTQLQLQFESGSMANGSSVCYIAAYQGTCASLSYVGCQAAEEFISSVYGVYNVLFSGLDDTKDVWLYMYNDGGKSFNLTFNMVGSGTPPTNSSCASSSTALGSACNLAAPGASFTTPGAAAVACTGGNWGSNENTTFYSFVPTATTADLNITDIVCNDGTAGQAQFGVWTSCAAIGTYGAGFLGCAVGTSNLSLTGLTVGQTYYIAADGYAGDNCTWSFTGSGIVLPIELTKLTAKIFDSKVKIEWETASERNNDYFTIERSLDAETFEVLTTVKGAGNSNHLIKYSEIDNYPFKNVSYYRLKQTDFDGRFVYSRNVTVDNINNEFTIVPNPSASENGFTLQNVSNSEVLNIIITDITGKVVLNKEYNTETGNIEIKQSLSPGIYLIKVINSVNVVSQKLIIE